MYAPTYYMYVGVYLCMPYDEDGWCSFGFFGARYFVYRRWRRRRRRRPSAARQTPAKEESTQLMSAVPLLARILRLFWHKLSRCKPCMPLAKTSSSCGKERKREICRVKHCWGLTRQVMPLAVLCTYGCCQQRTLTYLARGRFPVQLTSCGQSYKHFTLVNYDSRVVIWG